MAKKKILIVSRSFYPQNSPRSFRTTELAKEFSRQGHVVTVITPKDNKIHKKFEQKHGVTINDLGQPIWKTIKLKGNGLSLLLRRLIRRLSILLLQYPNIELMFLVKAALAQEKAYDLLISIAAPHTVHWGVAWTWSSKTPVANTWVADCGDPFMGQENDSFNTPFYFKFIEKWFCKRADFITVPTKGAIQAYYPEFHHKIKVIPQGFRFEDVKKINGTVNNSVPVFAYAGGFIPGRRDPTEFLEYLINIEQSYVFHIYTNSSALITPYLKKAKGRIILHDALPRLELLYQLSQMDFVINFENLGNKQTPSKLIDYAIIKKPILSIKTGDLKENIINQFLEGQYANQLHVNNSEQYRIENVCHQFLELA